MRRKNVLLTAACALMLTACAGGSGNSAPAALESPTDEGDTETQASDGTDETKEETEAAAGGEHTYETNADGIWIPSEAPAVSNAKSAEEKLADERAIMEKGVFLFSGEENEGYYPSDVAFLEGAGENDMLALVYSCDDVTHGGWGVLGLNVEGKQEEIIAYADNPDQERLLTYTVGELLEIAGVANVGDIGSLALGAWNGGHITALYFLSGDVALEMSDYLAAAAEDEQIIHTYTGELSNPNAIDSARAVYSYLQEIYGTACLTGQMESTWMGSADYEMNYIESNTGKLPAIRGLDFMNNDFAGVVSRAESWWEKGGIVTINWHTGADFSSSYNECLADDINWEEAFVPGSDTYNSLVEGMDRAVPYLQQLEDAGVPVLWRPFHELDGGWFWWSKGGSENFVKLWQMMYSRYTDYWGLDNLIWVFGYSHNGVDLASWYPGDAYVDLLGGDSYTPGANAELYKACAAVAPEGMPIIFHECGTIPSADQMAEAETPWLYFMVWHTDYITDTKNNSIASLKEIYNGDYFITLDELPAFK